MVNDLNSTRPRRIVQYPRNTHYGDVAFTPAWLQWLRHTRKEIPSVQEQLSEVQRQENLKYLAAKADDRWNSQKSYLDAPEETGQLQPLLQPRNEDRYGAGTQGDRAPEGLDTTSSAVESETEQLAHRQEDDLGTKSRRTPRQSKPNPWAQAAGNPGESWQPQQWQPGQATKR